VPSHLPVGACTPSQTPTHWSTKRATHVGVSLLRCTPSQTPTHWSVSPATHVGVSPLPTPSWGSAIPGMTSAPLVLAPS
jgi:hypothetical protein